MLPNGFVGLGTSTPSAELDIMSGDPDDGVEVHLSNLDTSHFLRLYSGRENLPTPIMYWNHGDALEIGMADPDEGNYKRFLRFNGKSIGVYNTGGSVYIGENAGLNYDLTGNVNVGIGTAALKQNVEGFANVAIGVRAMENNTTGDLNVAVGYQALMDNDTGTYNVAVGTFAMAQSVSGSYNTALGYNALGKNRTGHSNVALGRSAGGSRTGSLNVAIGNGAMTSDSSGSQNVVIGISAMSNNTTGSSNTIIGYLAGRGSSGQSYSGNVLLGHEAGRNINDSNRLYIENSDSNTPLIYGEFDNNLIRINGRQEITESLSIGTTGNVALRVNSAETIWYNGTYLSWGFGAAHNYFARPVRMGPIQGSTTPYADLHVTSNQTSGVSVVSTTGEAILQLGGNGANNINAHWTIRRDTSSSGSLVWRHGAAHRMTMDIAGNVGIGTSITLPGYKLEVDGTAGKPGGGSWSNSSDRRLKQNVNGYHDGLSKIQKIRPVTFQYNELSGYDTEPEYVGVIAQELQEVAPYMVSENETGYLDVNNSAMTYMLVNAVQEQQEMIKALQEEVASLKATVESIKN
jgi:hypothetical protein